MRRLITVSFMIAGILTSAHLIASDVAIKMLIDNKPGPSDVISVKGHYYVSIDEMAKSLNASLSVTTKPKEGTVIAITLPQQEQIKNIENGEISGVVTYFFNPNFGSKPDVGSTVWLIKEEVKLSKTNIFVDIVDVGLIIDTSVPKDDQLKTQRKVSILQRVSVDGNGRYEIKNIPAGKYTLIIKSKHRTTSNVLDILGDVDSSYVEVKAGKTSDISHDFHYNKD